MPQPRPNARTTSTQSLISVVSATCILLSTSPCLASLPSSPMTAQRRFGRAFDGSVAFLKRDVGSMSDSTVSLCASNGRSLMDCSMRGGGIEMEEDGGYEEEEEEDEEDEDMFEDSGDEYEDEESEESEEVSQEESDVEEAQDVEVSTAVSYDPVSMPSGMSQMIVTVGVMLLSRSIDFNSPQIIQYCRIAFLSYIVLVQLFTAFVRIQAKRANNRTAISITTHPLLNSLLPSSTPTIAKDFASKILSNQSTVLEYDLSQASQLGNKVLFPMVLLWVLHFKMGQVQPLLYQTATGFLNLVYSPLWQVYCMGKNLERPWKFPQMASPFKPDGDVDADVVNEEEVVGEEDVEESVEEEEEEEETEESEEYDSEEEEDEQ